MRRHKSSGHVPASILNAFPRHRADLSAEALAQLRADESAGVLLHLAQQRSTLLRLQDEAERKKWRPLMLQAARELHRNIELTGRTLGTFAEHERAVTQVAHLQVLMSPEYVALRGDLIKALSAYPRARSAVAEVLGRLEGAAPHFTGTHPPRQIEGRARWRRRMTSMAADLRLALDVDHFARSAGLEGGARSLAAPGAGGRCQEDPAQLQPTKREVDDGGIIGLSDGDLRAGQFGPVRIAQPEAERGVVQEGVGF